MEIKHLLTKEGESLSHKEYDLYPRPQLRRDSFFSLNGIWRLCCEDYEGDILVPYPPESILSGVGRLFSDGATMIYTKKFTLPEGFLKDRLIIHFGAVDRECTVFINGNPVGENVGGYNSFFFDITDHIVSEGENTLLVQVRDTLSDHILPYGKQRRKRGGMWYTPVSGIWQSVWLESVPKNYITSLKMDISAKSATVFVYGCESGEVTVKAPEGEIKLEITPYESDVGIFKFEPPVPKNWSPCDPYLYYFTLKCDMDTVESYFALREISVGEISGIKRILLNSEPVFLHAVLDQGYFSDGIYTPASPFLYAQDVERMRSLGFNTLRKHIKVEPEWFYYECDRQGMIVMQDMVNNGRYSFLKDTALPTVGIQCLPDTARTREQKNAFLKAMEQTVNQLYNHPCVCYYTIFNEGWGQFDADEVYERLGAIDHSRIIDSTSGWFAKKKSDVTSLHVYFKPVKIKKSPMPIVLSEFGGYSYKESGHCANENKTYGYKFFKDRDEYEKSILALYENEIIPQIDKGLCGAVYTQLSDVEDETNGLLTYDRRVTKVCTESMLKIAEMLKIK